MRRLSSKLHDALKRRTVDKPTVRSARRFAWSAFVVGLVAIALCMPAYAVGAPSEPLIPSGSIVLPPGHSFKLTSAQDPTCTSDGWIEYTCGWCGLVERETIPALGHDWGPWTTVRPATEDQEGISQSVCNRCGQVRSAAIPKLEHVWSGWTVVQYPTCTTQGTERRTCTADPQHVHYEYRAIPTLSPNGQHDYVQTASQEPTCEEGGWAEYACRWCGDVYYESIPALEHDWGPWAVVRPATEGQEGLAQSVCSLCGQVRTEPIPKLAPAAPIQIDDAESPCGQESGAEGTAHVETCNQLDRTLLAADAVVVGLTAIVVCVLAVPLSWMRRRKQQAHRDFLEKQKEENRIRCQMDDWYEQEIASSSQGGGMR